MDEDRFYGNCSFVGGNRMEVANVRNKLRASWGMRGNWLQSLLRFDRRGRLSERPNRKPVKLGEPRLSPHGVRDGEIAYGRHLSKEKAAHIRARPRPVLGGSPTCGAESDLRGADPLVCIRCSQDLVIACQNWGLALENFGKTKFFKRKVCW